jgi:hypothetical protein
MEMNPESDMNRKQIARVGLQNNVLFPGTPPLPGFWFFRIFAAFVNLLNQQYVF